MKLPIISACVVLAAAFMLSACGLTNRINQNTGNKVAEKIIEAQTGGKVKVDSTGDNVTIKTEDGQTQYSAGGAVKLPDNFPKELQVVDDPKYILASSSDKGGSVAYLTNFDQKLVFEKYLEALQALDWKKEAEVDVGNGKMLNFSKNNMAVSISIGDNQSKDESAITTVNVIYVFEDN